MTDSDINFTALNVTGINLNSINWKTSSSIFRLRRHEFFQQQRDFIGQLTTICEELRSVLKFLLIHGWSAATYLRLLTLNPFCLFDQIFGETSSFSFFEKGCRRIGRSPLLLLTSVQISGHVAICPPHPPVGISRFQHQGSLSCPDDVRGGGVYSGR